MEINEHKKKKKKKLNQTSRPRQRPQSIYHQDEAAEGLP